MPEAPKESKSAAGSGALEPDLVEGPPPTSAEQGSAVLSFARGMGAAARAMSDGLGGIGDLFRPRRPRPIKRPAESLETLLTQLQEKVTAAESPMALGEDEAFWQLVRKLFHFQRRRRLQKSPDEPVEAEARARAEGAGDDGAKAATAEGGAEGDAEKKPAKKRRRTQEAKAAAPPKADEAAAEEAPAAEDADMDSLLPTESEEGAEAEAEADKKKKS